MRRALSLWVTQSTGYNPQPEREPYPAPQQLVGHDPQRPPVHLEGIARPTAQEGMENLRGWAERNNRKQVIVVLCSSVLCKSVHSTYSDHSAQLPEGRLCEAGEQQPVPALTGSWGASHPQGQPSQHGTALPTQHSTAMGTPETPSAGLEPERDGECGMGWGGQEEEAGWFEEGRVGWRGLDRM